MSQRFSILLALVALALMGCGSGAQNPPDGAIRIFHAAPGQAAIRFLRVERSEAELNYKEGSAVQRVDKDTYRFNVEVATPAGSDRVLSFTRTIEAGTEYSFILYENAGAVDVLEYDKPSPELAAGDDSELQLFHMAAGVGAVDVYLETAGAGIGGATPWGSVSFTGRIDPEPRAPGDYQLFFTQVNNPGNVLFTTPSFTLEDAGNVTFFVVAGAGAGTAALSVVVSTGSGVSGELFDENQQPALRAFHGARTADPLNVVVDGQFGAPLISDLVFGQLSSYETIPAEEFDLVVTPADNAGVFEVERTLTVPAGNLVTLLLVGEPGALSGIAVLDDNRSISTIARLQVINQAEALGTIDVYIVEPGTDITAERPTELGLALGASTGYRAFAEGDYELIFTEFGGDTPIYGPEPIQLSNGGVYSAIVLDGVDSGTVEPFLIDDSP